MKILLINPPDDLEAIMGGGAVFVPNFEPLGLLYVAAVCRDAGYEVSVIDAFAERLPNHKLHSRIQELNPDVIGFTSFTCTGGFIYECGQQIKKERPQTLVVFGNIHASVYAEQYLSNKCCDAVVHGEGEYTFLSLLKVKDDPSLWPGVPSISFMADNKFVTTSAPKAIEDISRLPLPARDLVDQRFYSNGPISHFRSKGLKKGKLSKHMLTSRGCSHRCTFCVVHNDSKQKYNTISNVIKEIEILINEYNAGYIVMMDPNFIGDRARTIELCKELYSRGLKVSWGCCAQVNTVDEELLKYMELAGCTDIAFGIESGVERLLNNVRKGITLEKIEAAVKLVKQHTKIDAVGMFILGLPGETYNDSLATIKFALRLPLDKAQFGILTPYPGSDIFKELRAKNDIDTGVCSDGTVDISVWARYSSYISYTDKALIWTTPGLTSAQLKALQKKATRRFYLRPRQLFEQIKMLQWWHLPLYIKAFMDTFF
jgi:radical SAM superfamily enzyme YgiQ (UPF0313 family)